MNVIRTWSIFAAAVLLSAAQESAFAQSSSLFNNSGSRSSGGGSQTGSLSSQSSAGSLQGGGGLGSGGRRGTGGGLGGGTGSGSAFDGPQINEVGSLSSQSVGRGTGFVGQQNQGTFVGNRLAGAGNTNAMQPSFGGLGGGGGSRFNSQNSGRNGGQQGASRNRPFRPQYRIGFEYRPAAAEISERATVQMRRFTAVNPALAGLEIAVDAEGTAEIRGQAPDDDARQLVENLVRLVPGVRGVNNLVEVPPPAANP